MTMPCTTDPGDGDGEGSGEGGDGAGLIPPFKHSECYC